jgi:hypothetical protein
LLGYFAIELTVIEAYLHVVSMTWLSEKFACIISKSSDTKFPTFIVGGQGDKENRQSNQLKLAQHQMKKKQHTKTSFFKIGELSLM